MHTNHDVMHIIYFHFVFSSVAMVPLTKCDLEGSEFGPILALFLILYSLPIETTVQIYKRYHYMNYEEIILTKRR